MTRAPREGDELPPLVVPITRTLIVAGAVASRDYQDVHHDAEAARAKGSPDIFMNILTTNGLVGRYITDWAGPRAELRTVRIRLGAPNHPGHTMTLSGRVTAVDGDLAEVSVTGANGLGSHVTGTVTVRIPCAAHPASASENERSAASRNVDRGHLPAVAGGGAKRPEASRAQEGEATV